MTTPPESITINYIAPDGTVTDITRSVLFSDAYFESQAAAVPGSFHLTVKDPDQTLGFVSGGRVELELGGQRMFGGFLNVPTRDFFFPADRTDRPVRTRRWSLDGVDYNLLLDKRVLRRTADYTHAIPSVPVGSNGNDSHIIGLFSSYFDLGFSGGGTIDVTSRVPSTPINVFTNKWVWPTQGSTMRQTLDALVIETTIHGLLACIYWLDAEAKLVWLAIPSEEDASPWGFSDIPDPDAEFPFIGWRDGSASEDGSSVINDVFIWGGSPIGTNGAVVMAHRSNAESVSAHGRWQMAEAHPGEDGYKSQAEVNARANALISGDTSGTSPVTGAQGLVNPDMQYSLTWFAHDVPVIGGVRSHLVPGKTVTLNLWSFSEDDGVTPYAVNLPLRQVRITFPTLPSDNPELEPLTYVQFQGQFSLSMSDPVWWWQYLRTRRPALQAAPVVTTNNSSTTFPYGSYFTDAPQESPDGARTLFSIVPTYVPGSLAVWKDGLSLAAGTAFSETSPDAGTFTLSPAPAGGAVIICTCRTG